MKSARIIVTALVLQIVLQLLVGSPAHAGNSPIPEIGIVVDTKPEPTSLRSDASGNFHLGSISPGTYTLEIDGPALAEAVVRMKSPGNPQVAVSLVVLLKQPSRHTLIKTIFTDVFMVETLRRNQQGKITRLFTVPQLNGAEQQSYPCRGTLILVR